MPIKGLKPHTHKTECATMPPRVCNNSSLSFHIYNHAIPWPYPLAISTRFIAPFWHFLPSHGNPSRLSRRDVVCLFAIKGLWAWWVQVYLYPCLSIFIYLYLYLYLYT